MNIKKALNRKVISSAYHSNVPVFLKSNGPFAIYDHSLKYGSTLKPKETTQNYRTVTDYASEAALRRHEQDLLQIKKLREEQKS